MKIVTDELSLCRRNMLEKKLADTEATPEEQTNIRKYLEKKETEYMRLQRHKMGAEDFEPLTMIGKGAFGEVICYFSFLSSVKHVLVRLICVYNGIQSRFSSSLYMCYSINANLSLVLIIF